MPDQGALTDAALLRASAAGDAEAFTRFVERHYGRVLRWARLQVRVAADAEDAVQDAFLAAWRNAGSFRGDGPARAWMFSITRHALARATRRRAGQPAEHASLDDATTLEDAALEAGWGRPDADEASSDAADAVPAALARLAPADREILTLRDVEGLSGEDTAATLGVSLQAMKSRLHRARLRFTAAYEEVRRARP